MDTTIKIRKTGALSVKITDKRHFFEFINLKYRII
jgi:hypothetical protein